MYTFFFFIKDKVMLIERVFLIFGKNLLWGLRRFILYDTYHIEYIEGRKRNTENFNCEGRIRV